MRIIPVKITRVINIHHHPKFQNIKKSDEYEYIGRGSVWGNPYAMNGTEQESREEVINKFKYDFDKDILMKAKKEQVYLLAGKRLGCFVSLMTATGMSLLISSINGMMVYKVIYLSL